MANTGSGTIYTLRQASLTVPERYNIAKWEWGANEPSATYLVQNGECFCPARGGCKHTRIARLLIDAAINRDVDLASLYYDADSDEVRETKDM